MSLRLSLSRAIALALALCLGQRAAADGLPRQRVIVKLDLNALPEAWLPPADVQAQRDAILLAQFDLFTELADRNVELTQVYETIPYLALDVPQEALLTLAQSPLVEVINGDAFSAPDLWETTWQVGARQSWAEGIDGGGAAIAVLDTGVDSSHPLLAGKVVTEACFSANGSCPNRATASLGAGSGAPCDYASECAHGTHVAGIAAGAGPMISGVARGSNVIAIQVFSRVSGALCGTGTSPCARSYVSDQVAALEYVYSLRMTHDIAAVNLSLGGGRYSSTGACDSANSALKAAIDNLREAGIATVAAAGNAGWSGALSAPACISSAVSVGAVTKSDSIPYWSSSASFLKLLAPGSMVVSSAPGDSYRVMSGTSMAAPHVAGAFALLHQRDPSATVDAALARLRDTGKLIGDPRNGRSFPRIALTDALAGWGAAPTISLTTLDSGENVASGQRVTVTWTRAVSVARADVYFSRDGGLTWKRIARTRNGYFVWRTPTVKTAAAACRVKVVAYDAKGKSLAFDRSSLDFRLEPRT